MERGHHHLKKVINLLDFRLRQPHVWNKNFIITARGKHGIKIRNDM